MRRAAVATVIAAGLVTAVLTLGLAATRESRLVYTIGAGPGGPIAELRGGDEACQVQLAPPPERFERVVVHLGTYDRPGVPVEVLVRTEDGSRTLSQGRLAGGYPDIARAPEHAIPIAPLTVREPVQICLRNAGRRKVAVYGAPAIAHRTSYMTLDGKPANADIALRLERSEARSLLARLPETFEHAARFKAAIVGPWTFWMLGALVLIAVPLLLAVSLGRALRDERS